MGLDASVRCRCWEKGLCAPTRLKAHVYINSEDNDLSIDLPWETHKEEILEFDRWTAIACEHPHMRQASVRISNWAGVRMFQNALRTADEKSFSCLLSEIPNVNGGLTSPQAARTCLQKLGCFEALGSFGRFVRLIDRETGATIMDRIEAYDGWFKSNGSTGYRFSLEADGYLHIRHPKAGTVFSSREFSQVKMPDGTFAYNDFRSNIQFICPNGIEDQSTLKYPTALQVTVGADHSDNYVYLISNLRQIFSASLEVGHPIAWC